MRNLTVFLRPRYEEIVFRIEFASSAHNLHILYAFHLCNDEIESNIYNSKPHIVNTFLRIVKISSKKWKRKMPLYSTKTRALILYERPCAIRFAFAPKRDRTTNRGRIGLVVYVLFFFSLVCNLCRPRTQRYTLLYGGFMVEAEVLAALEARLCRHSWPPASDNRQPWNRDFYHPLPPPDRSLPTLSL